LRRTLQAQWTKHNGATLARSLLIPGAAFWIKPFGVDNLGGLVGLFYPMCGVSLIVAGLRSGKRPTRRAYSDNAQRPHQNPHGGSHRARWPEVPLGCGGGEVQRRGGCKTGNSDELRCRTHTATCNDYPEVGSTPARRSAEGQAMTPQTAWDSQVPVADRRAVARSATSFNRHRAGAPRRPCLGGRGRRNDCRNVSFVYRAPAHYR
jgi:hypothetical protein